MKGFKKGGHWDSQYNFGESVGFKRGGRVKDALKDYDVLSENKAHRLKLEAEERARDKKRRERKVRKPVSRMGDGKKATKKELQAIRDKHKAEDKARLKRFKDKIAAGK